MTRFLLFVSSLAPLLAIIAVRLLPDEWLASAVLGGVALVSVIAIPFILKARRQTATQPFTVVEVKDESQQVPAYLLTYAFPLVFAAVDGWQSLVGYLIFGLLMVVLLLRTDLALVNPILLLVGIRMYAVRTSTGADIVLLSRERPLAGSSLLATRLSGSTYKLDRLND